jgi:hypothetical protein
MHIYYCSMYYTYVAVRQYIKLTYIHAHATELRKRKVINN